MSHSRTLSQKKHWGYGERFNKNEGEKPAWPKRKCRKEIPFRRDKECEVDNFVMWGLVAYNLLVGGMLYHCNFQEIRNFYCIKISRV